MTRTKTREEFEVHARTVHGPTYDYSRAIYLSCKTKVEIICPQHGSFWQTPNNHLNNHGCPACPQRVWNRKTSLDFEGGCKRVHGEVYDYSRVRYTRSDRKVEIVCPQHGSFWQTPNSHLNSKSGCPRCAECRMYPWRDSEAQNRTQAVWNKTTTSDFIKKAATIHGDRWDYSRCDYRGSKTPVEIVCPNHGGFWQTPSNHLSDKNGCPKCFVSRGEEKIRDLLLAHPDLPFVCQATFEDCFGTGGGRLKFDFFLPTKGVVIEYDGLQHFKPVQHGGMSRVKAIAQLEKTKTHDALKDAYCLAKGWKMIRITYLDDLESRMVEVL